MHYIGNLDKKCTKKISPRNVVKDLLTNSTEEKSLNFEDFDEKDLERE